MGILPEVIPARMVNEFAYCPRLFHLEWVGREWADNADTADGDRQHRRVDRPRGKVAGDGLPFSATSLSVTSDRLGLTAVIDLLEGDGSSVRPIDTKKGRPPPDHYEESAWLTDRVQICVQALILRDQGYRCDVGELYYAAVRRRVVVEIDDDLVAVTLRMILDLRETASEPIPPPPLVDSPKCPRCSLVSICLPDEKNMLSGRQATPTRRYLARAPSARPLHVTEQGAQLTKKGERLVVRRGEDELGSIRLIDVASVSFHGNISISPQLLRTLMRRDVTVGWFSTGGWLDGVGTSGWSGSVELRRRQVLAAEGRPLQPAREMVRGKISNCRTLLRRNARSDVGPELKELARMVRSLRSVESQDALLGAEGNAARVYFSAFSDMLTPRELPGGTFEFRGRNRRPPKDPVNALLSFVYGLIVRDLVGAITVVGLDPYCGLYHQPRFGRPSLALDLAEEFRPLVGDSVVISVINNEEIQPHHFLVRGGGVALTAEGRRKLIAAYERRMDVEVTHPIFGYKVAYRRLIELQVRLFAGWLMDEIERYEPFVTR